jgi:hypothetical protein
MNLQVIEGVNTGDIVLAVDQGKISRNPVVAACDRLSPCGRRVVQHVQRNWG